MTALMCPVCRLGLGDPHDDPVFGAVCPDCCVACNPLAVGDSVEVPGQGVGVIIANGHHGSVRVLVRHCASGPVTVTERIPRGWRRTDRPTWAIKLLDALTAPVSDQQVLPGVGEPARSGSLTTTKDGVETQKPDPDGVCAAVSDDRSVEAHNLCSGQETITGRAVA